MDTIVSPHKPPRSVPSLRVFRDEHHSASGREWSVAARILHDSVAQALFRAELAVSELAERVVPGSVERDLADEALEAVQQAVVETRQEIDRLRTLGQSDGR